MLRNWVVRFLALFTVGLAIVALWLAFRTDGSLSEGRIAAMTIVAVGGVGAGSVILLLLYHFVADRIPRILRRFAVWVTFKTIKGAIANRTLTVKPIGITTINDDVAVGLRIGSSAGVTKGHQFAVLNAADLERWGTLEAASVDENSCICIAVDRINSDFWNDLERKMRHVPTFPGGVTIRREVPDEELTQLAPRPFSN